MAWGHSVNSVDSVGENTKIISVGDSWQSEGASPPIVTIVSSILVRIPHDDCKNLRASMFWHMSHKFTTIVTNVFDICRKGL